MFDQRLATRAGELALAHVRSSSMLSRAHMGLRKMSALINRDDAAGVIVQRIIGSDQVVVRSIDTIFGAMWQTEGEESTPSIPEAIELFGWPIVREIACVVLLHSIHDEFAFPASMRPLELDRQAVSVLTAASEFRAHPVAALLANVGIPGLFAIGGERFEKRLYTGTTEERAEYERSVFGFDHGNLAAAMLWEADMPPEICLEVFDHAAVGTPILIGEHVAADLGFDAGFPLSCDDIQIDTFTQHRYSASKMARLRRSMISAAALPDVLYAGGALAA